MSKRQPVILIEASPILQNRSGVGQYCYRLFDALFALESKQQFTLWGFLFLGKHFQDPYDSRHKNLRYRLVRYLPAKIYNFLTRRVVVLPAELLAYTKSDLAIFTNCVRTPLLFSKKSITFIYDLSFLYFP